MKSLADWTMKKIMGLYETGWGFWDKEKPQGWTSDVLLSTEYLLISFRAYKMNPFSVQTKLTHFQSQNAFENVIRV